MSTIRSCLVEDSATGTRRKDRQLAVQACAADDTADDDWRRPSLLWYVPPQRRVPWVRVARLLPLMMLMI